MQFLLIGRIPEGVEMEQAMPYVQAEAQKVWEKYSADVVRSIHYIADMSGAVLMCEAESLSAMQKIAWIAYQRGQSCNFNPHTWEPELLWNLPLNEVRAKFCV